LGRSGFEQTLHRRIGRVFIKKFLESIGLWSSTRHQGCCCAFANDHVWLEDRLLFRQDADGPDSVGIALPLSSPATKCAGFQRQHKITILLREVHSELCTTPTAHSRANACWREPLPTTAAGADWVAPVSNKPFIGGQGLVFIRKCLESIGLWSSTRHEGCCCAFANDHV